MSRLERGTIRRPVRRPIQAEHGAQTALALIAAHGPCKHADGYAGVAGVVEMRIAICSRRECLLTSSLLGLSSGSWAQQRSISSPKRSSWVGNESGGRFCSIATAKAACNGVYVAKGICRWHISHNST